MIAAWLSTVTPLSGVDTIHLGFVTEGDVVHMVYRDGTAVMYKRSENEGHTWGSPVTVVASGIDEVPLNQPIACNGDYVHVVYVRDTNDAGAPPKLYYKRSTDGGANWSGETTFDDGVGDPNNGIIRLALLADADGYVHCVWSSNAVELRYLRSTDNGATWDTPYDVIDASAQAGRPDAVISGSNVHVTWTDFRHGSTNNGGETYYTKSTDRGVTWETSQRITTTASQDTLRATIAAAGARVVLAWQWPIFTEEVLWTYSTDGGDTWATAAELTSGDNYEHASLAYHDGIFAIAYTDQGAAPTRTYVQISSDNGQSWAAAQLPYTPSNNAAAPLLQFSTRFLIMVDRQDVASGIKLLRSPVLSANPNSDLLDDFNRADDATPPPGANWTNGITTFVADEGVAIVSNQACRKSTGGYRQGSYYSATTFSNLDAIVEVSGWTDTLNNGFVLFARLQQVGAGTTDGYEVNVDDVGGGTGLWTLGRVTNTVLTNIGVGTTSRDVNVGDKVAISCRDDLMIAWHQPGGSGEWTQVTAAIDTTYAGPGFVGLEFVNNQDTKITNLWASEIAQQVGDPPVSIMIRTSRGTSW